MMFVLVILLAVAAAWALTGLYNASKGKPARAFVPGLNPARPPMG